MKYRKRPIIIEATRWFKNGDHPQDGYETHPTEGWQYEGKVVRYFRHSDVAAAETCKHCGRFMNVHGWIDTLEGGYIVCPGDWIITGVNGEYYPCKPDIFDATYDCVENTNGPWVGKRYDLKGLNGRDQYVLIDEEGIMVSFPDNKRENWNYQATATLATRLISICMRAKVGMNIIKKQLIDSSMQKSDTPDLLLEAINKFEEDRKK